MTTANFMVVDRVAVRGEVGPLIEGTCPSSRASGKECRLQFMVCEQVAELTEIPWEISTGGELKPRAFCHMWIGQHFKVNECAMGVIALIAVTARNDHQDS